MDSTRTDRTYTPEEFAAILDQAKERAAQLRSDAQAAFWKDVAAWLGRAWKRFTARAVGALDQPVDRSWPQPIR